MPQPPGPSKYITTVWIAPTGPRWGVTQRERWNAENLPRHLAGAIGALVFRRRAFKSETFLKTFLCTLLFVALSGPAFADVKEAARNFDKRWAQCEIGSFRNDYDRRECVRVLTLEVAGYMDKMEAQFLATLRKRPGSERLMTHWDSAHRLFVSGYRNPQCRFEETFVSGEEHGAYVAKARCHYRTALAWILRMNNIIYPGK